jgi:M6 family metalloprotease-like protein
MKRLFHYLAAVLAGVLIGVSPNLQAASPTLADFGYGNMTTKRAIPSVLILVNFTNDTAETVYTVPYMMGGNPVGNQYTTAERYYSNWFFGLTTSPISANGYFHENSNGRFRWLPGGVYMVLRNTNDLYGAFYDRNDEDGPAANTAYMSAMIRQAMAQGFDLLSFDTTGDRGVNELECTIQLITNDKTFGGGARSLTLPVGSGTNGGFFSGNVTIQRYTMGLRVIAEELIHVLQNGHCGDIYGPSSLSDGFSTMSGGDILHVDAWHKLQLAWSEPRLYSLRVPGVFSINAAQLMDPNAPVILYDPIRGLQEFFVLEYRTTRTSSVGAGFDPSVADSGLVIWHVQQNSGHDPVNYTTTYFPDVEENWRRCVNCLSLFYNHGDSRPCALARTNHFAEDGHIVLPCNDPQAPGVPGWRWCQKCGQLYYHPNVASSLCPAGQRHESGACDYRLQHDDEPTALGYRGWWHCGKCQTLFHPMWPDDPAKRYCGICPSGGQHENAPDSTPYTVLWTGGVRCMMTAGAPDLARGRGRAWHPGEVTPPLRWYDGTESPTRLAVLPGEPYADSLSVEIRANYDVWVDFAYTGTEDGTFAHPYNTFSDGASVVWPTGTLHLKAGSSPERPRVTKPMKLEAHGGPVMLGRP